MIQKFAELTEQELFDKVAKHLLTQNKKSLDGEECVYRSADGLKCAAGCLIEDSEYATFLENQTWEALVRCGRAKSVHVSLIQDLQLIHDDYETEQWPNKLESLAEELNLKFNETI